MVKTTLTTWQTSTRQNQTNFQLTTIICSQNKTYRHNNNQKINCKMLSFNKLILLASLLLSLLTAVIASSSGVRPGYLSLSSPGYNNNRFLRLLSFFFPSFVQRQFCSKKIFDPGSSRRSPLRKRRLQRAPLK